VLIIVSAVIVPVLSAVLLANWLVKSALNERQQDLFNASQKAALESIEQAKNNGMLLAKELYNNPALVEAVARGDRPAVLAALKENYQHANTEIKVDALYVTDRTNKVLARSHNPGKFGDDKSNVAVFDKALKTGQPAKDWAIGKTGIEVLGAMPIKKDGQVIGVIAVGQHANQDMVEAINRVAPGEISLYWNDTAVATNSGEVKIGEKIENKEIIDLVLGKGETFTGIREEEDENKNVAYLPLKDMNSAVIGMVRLEKDREELVRDQQSIRNYLLLIGLIMAVIGALVGITFARRITGPLQEITAAGEAIAQGNLKIKINTRSGNDEIGILSRSFAQMVRTLNDLISKVSRSADNVATTSRELTTNAQNTAAVSKTVREALNTLSCSNEEQAASVKQTAGIVEQLTMAIDQIAAGAQEQAQNVNNGSFKVGQMAQRIEDVAASTDDVANAAKQASEAALKGGQVVEQTIAGMKRIKSTVMESGERIKQLGEQSKAIGEIIQVIDDIAEQTNLLALNAAIEAARAGEHGKGFAVVADEVRKLAERSGKATKEIAELIITIQKGTQNAVSAMEIGITEVEKGSEFANDAGQALKEILTTVNRANEQVQNISLAIQAISADSTEVVAAIDNVASITEENTAATEEMAAGSSEVSRAVSGMARLTEETTKVTKEVAASTDTLSDSAENIANSAEKLSEMAEELRMVIRQFQL